MSFHDVNINKMKQSFYPVLKCVPSFSHVLKLRVLVMLLVSICHARLESGLNLKKMTIIIDKYKQKETCQTLKQICIPQVAQLKKFGLI